MAEPSKARKDRPVKNGGEGNPATEPIVLKNRIAVLTPDPIAEGAHGKVYRGLSPYLRCSPRRRLKSTG